METVEMDERYRVTIPRHVRKNFKVTKGQKFFLIPYGNDLLMKPVPKDPSKRLDDIIGVFEFNRAVRRKAEKWALEQAGKKS